MPGIDYGEKINFSISRFSKLSSKGEKIQFRLVGPGYYDGKHFMRDEKGDWNIIYCPRINSGDECEYCEKFFKAHAKAKEEGLDQKEARKLTDPWSASIAFYFPVINRETHKLEVFQTTKGVRDAIEAELELGTKIMDRDMIVLRTETPGSYYKLSVVDSADTKKLTKDEKAEIDSNFNIAEYIHGKKDEGKIAVEANTETDDSDLPF